MYPFQNDLERHNLSILYYRFEWRIVFVTRYQVLVNNINCTFVETTSSPHFTSFISKGPRFESNQNTVRSHLFFWWWVQIIFSKCDTNWKPLELINLATFASIVSIRLTSSPGAVRLFKWTICFSIFLISISNFERHLRHINYGRTTDPLQSQVFLISRPWRLNFRTHFMYHYD